MGRARKTLSFVNRYVELAGRSCCAGRSWVGLDRSLARRAGEMPKHSCEMPAEPSEQETGERTVGSPVPR